MVRATKSRGKKYRIVTHESYAFRIEEVKPSYSFGVGHDRLSAGDFAEYLHTAIETVCVAPTRLEGRQTTFTLLGDRQIIERVVRRSTSSKFVSGIGTLTMRGTRSEYLGSLPYDAALAVPSIILLKGYRFIHLSGEGLRRGTATINFMSLCWNIDIDDY